jgi:uncharacterized protein YeaO (DUF488 family)
MKIKLTPVKPKYRNKYIINVKFMHGDADAYSTETYVCKHQDDFIRVMSLDRQWPDGCRNEATYDEWCDNLFGEYDDCFVPGDCTCDHQVRAQIESFTGFFYDEDGNEFKAELSDGPKTKQKRAKKRVA